MTFEQLIETQQPHLNRLVQDLARRYHLAATEIEEFRAAVEHALERNQYELLRAFEGRSTWETYLATVVTREFFQFQAALWGNWRPSAKAVRLGPAAMLLEELVDRDRFPVGDAIEWMRTTHRVDLPRHRIMQLAEQLGLVSVASSTRRPFVEAPLTAETREALARALALVSPDDRLIVELRYRDRQPLTRIAALMHIDARPLQRRIDTIKNIIRESLTAQGVNSVDIEALLRSAEGDAGSSHQHWWELTLVRPSKGTNV